MQRRTLALIAAVGGAFVAFLDATIVNTAFPDIGRHFPDASRADLSWILDAYFIVFAALLVPFGAIADRYGRKRIFQLSIVGFGVTSMMCAAAPTWELLVAARVLQGVATAGLSATSLALVLAEFPPEKRATGVGIWGAGAALAAAFGPPLGGILVEISDWRLIFLVNAPICVAIFAAGAGGLVESRDPNATRMPDVPGAIIIATALGLLALGIVEGQHWGWGSAGVIGSFVGAAALIAWFTRRCLDHPRPVIDPKLMAIPSFRIGNIGLFLFSAAFFSTILGNILFLTGVWGYSVLEAGLATIPGPVATTLVAGPAGKLADRYGHRVVIVPGALIYAGALFGLRSAGADPDFVGTWLPSMFMAGVGIGLAFPNMGAAAVAEVAPDRFGSASAVSSAFRQIGAVVGTAVLIAVVGEPESLAEALTASDRAYLIGVLGALLSAAVALGLRTGPNRAPGSGSADGPRAAPAEPEAASPVG